MTIRHTISVTTNDGPDEMTLRRYGMTSPAARKIMLQRRRAEQLMRSDASTVLVPRKNPKRGLLNLFTSKLIQLSDGQRLHPTKGFRPLTAYEKDQARG